MSSSSLDLGLFEDAVQRSGRKIIGWLAGDRHATELGRMLELPMTPAGRFEVPTIVSEYSKHLAYFHSSMPSADR
jgi:hypothetical protein